MKVNRSACDRAPLPRARIPESAAQRGAYLQTNAFMQQFSIDTTSNFAQYPRKNRLYSRLYGLYLFLDRFFQPSSLGARLLTWTHLVNHTWI